MEQEQKLSKRQETVLESYNATGFESYRGAVSAQYQPIETRNLKRGFRGQLYTEAGLRQAIIDANGDPAKLRKISREQYRQNSGYIEVIEYFKNMYYYRYISLPLFKGTANKPLERLEGDDLRLLAHSMSDIVDRLSLETLLPKQIETLLVDGVAYLYTFLRNGKPIVISLPYEFCSRYRVTSFDTETILFDFEFFVELHRQYENIYDKTVDLEEIFMMYPSAMKKQFYKYYDRTKKTYNRNFRYQELNIEHAAAITVHSDGVPPKLLVAAAKDNYDSAVDVQQRKGKSQIDSILTIELPSDRDGLPVFTANEATQIQRLISSQVANIDGLKVMTSFGEVNMLKTQPNESVKNESVSQAYNQIFEEALINPELFRADTDYALEVSLNRDAAFVWTILENIMNYYNLAINKLYSRDFKDYEVYIQLLPITKYNADVTQKAYRGAAEYGIGKLEAVVSYGIKQSVIFDKSELEKALKLDDILLPLQSSHTRSAQLQAAEKKGHIGGDEEKVVEEETEIKDGKELPLDEVRGNEE